jgi:bacillithiol biosynthesis deacetylase BshB1
MKIMFIGIHPDDIEMGCGGTVALAAAAGHDVTLVDLSRGDSSSNGTPEERLVEAEAAAKILGAARRINLGLPDTEIRSEDPAQSAVVIECLRTFRPELVFMPNKIDPHPDHSSGGALIERAVYLSGVHGCLREREAWRVETLLVYIGRLDMEPALIQDVTSVQERKMEAIMAHRSQFVLDPGRRSTVLNARDFLPFVEYRSRVFGRMIGVPFGEPFQLTRPIALSDLSIFHRSS